MKTVRKALPPQALSDFVARHPAADWDGLYNANPSPYKHIKQQLAQDQRYLCAYCEIPLLIAPEEDKDAGRDDFRVEHFHPKSPHHPPPNWALDWQNLLGTCHGGSSKTVRDPSRFATPQDPSCDVPKNNNDLTGIILNPLTDIPPLERMFSYDTGGETEGAMKVSPHCPAHLAAKAAQSIGELKLNAKRLVLLRAAAIKKMNKIIVEAVASGDDAALPSNYFDLNSAHWPAFPTLIRFLLGKTAEDYFIKHHYQG